jgi:putative transposase
MRLHQYTLTSHEVQDCASDILQGALKLKDQGRKCRASLLLSVLLYAAARVTSLCDACARLRAAPSDDAVRKALVAALPEPAELEKRLNAALVTGLPRRLLRRRKGRLMVAADLTLIPYHGQPEADEKEVYRCKAKSGTTHFHAYATLYLMQRGRRFTLALTRVTLAEPLQEVLARLLRRCRQAGLRPDLLLLDRQFYGAEVVRYLQAARQPFLMPVALRGRKPQHPKGPSCTQVFAAKGKSGWYDYSWRDGQGKRATVGICVVRPAGSRKALVYAYWGFQPASYTWVRQTYRRRFGIETSYRQLQQARIRTSTRQPGLRLLFVGIALLLRNLWVWLHLMALATPRRGGRQLRLERLRLRTLLLWLMHVVEAELGVQEEAVTAYVPM